jgi:cathepsin D
MATSEYDTSELIFGSYDDDKFEGDIVWHPVIDKLFWTIQLDDIKFNNKSLGICQDKTCLVIPDSGTSTLFMPSWAFEIVDPLIPYYPNC